ncbi:UNVERIFIED_CONTAM: L-aspartate oxidase, chloroplastic [Sesamum radiatum]|uniref:L-aspartate oxidase, chloroplastic n=1 Tax=Sesamum radiatum TaxID=300843 RepID=A0AAW2V7X6_SESRA
MASRVWTRPIVAKSLGDTVLNNIVHRTREVRRQLQLIMWEYVGIVRSTTRLQTAEKRIGSWNWNGSIPAGMEPTMVGLDACEMRNLFCCAKLVVSSALARQESRGLHYTIDFPYVEESKRLPTIIFPGSPVNSSTWSSRQLHKQQIC